MYNIYNPDTLIACRKAVDVDWCGDVGVYTGRETCDGANLA
ncbi:MAG: hypothetical protein Q8O99_04930 [bacterium]|nr:hypothetical protein [bacterium]